METRLPNFDAGLFRSSNFRLRVASAVVLIPLTLICIDVGGWIYATLVFAVLLLGLREWLRLIDPRASQLVIKMSYASLMIIGIIGFSVSPFMGLLTGFFLTLGLFVLARQTKAQRAHWIAAGIPYLAGSGLALLTLRSFPISGLGLTFYLFATVWATDIGAYFVGRLIGGPKLAPIISPSKTWSGLAGGITVSALIGYAVSFALGARLPGIGLALGVFVACVAQTGDLFKSFFKRRAGVKESGGLIPGHGGILDRIDGLVFAAIFLVIFEILVSDAINWW